MATIFRRLIVKAPIATACPPRLETSAAAVDERAPQGQFDARPGERLAGAAPGSTRSTTSGSSTATSA